jgi:hypothetical protein
MSRSVPEKMNHRTIFTPRRIKQQSSYDGNHE